MRIALVAAAAGLLGIANAAQAEGMTFSARVGPTLGMYQSDSSFTLTATPTAAGGAEGSETFNSDDSWENAYGAQLGFSAGMQNFFGDVAIEYLAVDSDADLDRTDILLTGGYLIGQHWSAFAGYRKGMQGSGAFDDETFNESGFFVGGGVGGVEMGPLLFGSSLAYNFSQAKDFPFDGDEFDYGGLSVKVSVSPKSMPQHSLQLRYQRFTGDERPNTLIAVVDNDEDGTDDTEIRLSDIELTESYVQLTYSYAFVF